MALHFPIARVRAIMARYPRSNDALECAAVQRLATISQEEADRIWPELVAHAVLEPALLPLLWPLPCRQYPELVPMVRHFAERAWSPARHADTEAAGMKWVIDQGDSARAGSLLNVLLDELGGMDLAAGEHCQNLARYYVWRDLVVTHLVAPELVPLQLRLFGLLDMQAQQWGRPYVAGYAYQGYERLGIAGAKPTQERLEAYGFLPWLRPDMSVLEIGCNNGFMALEMARYVQQVDAIEYNPYLVEIGRVAGEALGQRNVHFEVADFALWRPRQRYHVVLSFANHCTIDGNLAMDFEDFVAKLWQLTLEGGHVLFESHNVFGPGAGTAGDDGDLDRKFDVVERYFELLDSKMTRCFVPVHDVDKLFVVLRRRPQILAQTQRRMQLGEARQRYEFAGSPFSA
ncbi:class I SAM-dependent methyltransferase [Chitinilyticum litopenaei]|uniref:class I SAM-dependent methyltransferase n=1 Tax=Chitinilyticum litopenaei TaxID=1121276 RepID=UPI0003FFE175|nr:class I SAM-dependent methyltransferase [Chitinilyticum litopenaei]